MTGKKGETPSNEGLIDDSATMLAERQVQPRFSFSEIIQLLAVAALFVGIWQLLGRQPNRTELGTRSVRITYARADVRPQDVYPLQLVGAWVVSSSDPRFGGFSGLAVTGEDLLALTDQGSIAGLPKPSSLRRTGWIGDLPAGPSSGRYTWNRDSEALSRDPLGRGWWVSFEKHHELWLYDPRFKVGLKRVRLGAWRWPTNLGVEGLVARPGPELLLFVEASDRMFRMRGGRGVAMDLQGRQLLISEAALLPGGEVVALERGFGLLGFDNRLVTLAPTPTGYRIAGRIPLKLGSLDNIEGIAAESLPGGTTRLWMISDDNFQRPLRTMLLAVDIPPKRDER